MEKRSEPGGIRKLAGEPFASWLVIAELRLTEVQMKTSEAGWCDGRGGAGGVRGLKDSYPTLLRIFRFVCLSHESYGENKDDGWIPSSDFGSFLHVQYYMQACHFLI